MTTTRKQRLRAAMKTTPKVHFVGIGEEGRMAAEKDELQYLREENGRLTDQIMRKRQEVRDLQERVAEIGKADHRALMHDTVLQDANRRASDLSDRLHEVTAKHAKVMSLMGDFSYEVDWTGEVVALEHHRPDGGHCLISAGMYGHNVKDIVAAALHHECGPKRVLP